jgi:hypothetical protein
MIDFLRIILSKNSITDSILTPAGPAYNKTSFRCKTYTGIQLIIFCIVINRYLLSPSGAATVKNLTKYSTVPSILGLALPAHHKAILR